MTQEEILAEAKLTEKLNLASLKKYEQMELENKKRANKITRKAVSGPYIRYLSTAMPMVDDPESGCASKEERISVDDDDSQDMESEQHSQRDSGNSAASKPSHERTFLTFSDFDTFRSSFPRTKARNSQQKICPITRLPAKYFDPVTRLPYANLQAFKILREAYYSQLEAKGDKSDPEVATWLDWRQKNKPSKPTYLSQVSRPPAAFSSRGPPSATAVSQSPQLPTTPHPRQTTPSGASAAAAAANSNSQQNVVLPARTLNNSASVAAAAAAQSVVTQLLKSSQPHPTAAVTAQLPTQPVQTVKIGGHAAQVCVKDGSLALLPSYLVDARLGNHEAFTHHVIVLSKSELTIYVPFFTGPTSTRDGHHDPDCRTATTDRQPIANSPECTSRLFRRRRRNGWGQGPIGDHPTAHGRLVVSSATNDAPSARRADPHCVAAAAGAQCSFDQPAAEGLGVANRDPAKRGGCGWGSRRQQLPRGAAADCGGGVRSARSARRLPHQADCDDASRRGWRDGRAGLGEVGADCASDRTRWSTAPDRGFPRRRTVHYKPATWHTATGELEKLRRSTKSPCEPFIFHSATFCEAFAYRNNNQQ